MKTLLYTGLIAAVALTSPAFAHTHLKAAIPADGSTVASAPAEFVLTFSEPARITAISIQKEGGVEQKITALPTAAAAQATIPAPKLDNGRYTLTWRVVGDDGHVMNGKVTFTVGGPSSGAAGPDAHAGHH